MMFVQFIEAISTPIAGTISALECLPFVLWILVLGYYCQLKYEVPLKLTEELQLQTDEDQAGLENSVKR